METADELLEQGKTARREGRLGEAAEFYRRAAEAFAAVGEAACGAHAARHETEILLNAGETEQASRRILGVLEFYRERETPALEMANALRVAALVQESLGRDEAAVGFWSEAQGLYRAAGVGVGADEAEKRASKLKT